MCPLKQDEWNKKIGRGGYKKIKGLFFTLKREESITH